MFFFRKLFGLLFIGLLIFGLFGFFGRSTAPRYENAYRQGFIDGQQAAAAGSETAAEGAERTTSAVPGTQIYYRGHDFFFPGTGLLLCLVPLFAIGLMMAAGKRGRHGRRGPWGPCGPRHAPWKHGPWDQRQDSPQEKSPDDIDDRPGEPVKYA